MMRASLLLTALLQQPGADYWSGMKHRHLVLAYVITWAGQIGYVAWIWSRRRNTK